MALYTQISLSTILRYFNYFMATSWGAVVRFGMQANRGLNLYFMPLAINQRFPNANFVLAELYFIKRQAAILSFAGILFYQTPVVV
jgi:hypothetical protein